MSQKAAGGNPGGQTKADEGSGTKSKTSGGKGGGGRGGNRKSG